jgi:hypothetical protein
MLRYNAVLSASLLVKYILGILFVDLECSQRDDASDGKEG